MSQTKKVANIYNPLNQTEQELIDSFILRLKEFQLLYDELQKSDLSRPDQHYIIQGIRGSGKTTLLLRLYYEVKNDPKLTQKIIPVIFNEEQYHIRRLCKLWESIGEYLEEECGFEGITDEFEELFEKGLYEEKAFEVIAKRLGKAHKKVILFMDNIGDLLKKLNDQEHKQFREILLTTPYLKIIGASSEMIESTFDYSHPFFEFFKFIYLKGLGKKDCEKLLIHLATSLGKEEILEIVRNSPGRVETFRRLTGGVTRTIVLIFEIFFDDLNGDSFSDLEHTLDRVTPLYKHRMDDLPPPQQEIVDVIAIAWDAVTTKEIAKKTRMESKVVSAQLKQLEKARIVKVIKTDTKNNMYQLLERFFNIWYLMRCGNRGDKNRVKWFVRFLQSWCNERELAERANKHINALSGNKYNTKHGIFVAEALAQAAGLPHDLQDKLLTKARIFATEHDKTMLKHLSKSDLNLLKDAEEYYNKEEYKKCLQKLQNIKKQDGNVLYAIGLVFDNGFKDYEKAEKYCLKAVEKDNANAMFYLAFFYHTNFKDYKKSEEYYLKAIEKKHVMAMRNLAILFFIQNKKKQSALKFIRMALDIKPDPTVSCILIMTLLWNNNFEEAARIALVFFENKEIQEEPYGESIVSVLQFFIIKKQYHVAYNFFNKEEYKFKERFKPLYFALMHFMKDEYPNEFKRAGSEMTETVDEIISNIKQWEKKYA